MAEMTATEKIRNQQGNSNTAKKEAAPTKDKIILEFANAKDFTAQHSLEITTTMSLCRLVNALFKTLPDYEGCIIAPDQAGVLQCALYFHLSPTQNAQSIIMPADAAVSGNSVMAKYNRMAARSQNRKLALTDFGKELLWDFIHKGRNQEPQKFNWNQITVEQVDQPTYGQGVPLLKVMCIDLLKIIPKFYKNESKRFYQWNIQIMRPLSIVGMGTPNYQVSIARLDVKAVEDLAAEMGFMTATGSLPIVR